MLCSLLVATRSLARSPAPRSAPSPRRLLPCGAADAVWNSWGSVRRREGLSRRVEFASSRAWFVLPLARHLVLCHELQGPCRLTERLRDRERKPACRLLICLRHLASLLVSPVEDARGNPRLQTPCIAALA